MKIETKFDVGDVVWIIVKSMRGSTIILGEIVDLEIGSVVDKIDPQYEIRTDVGLTYAYESGAFGEKVYPNTPEGKRQAEARIGELNV